MLSPKIVASCFLDSATRHAPPSEQSSARRGVLLQSPRGRRGYPIRHPIPAPALASRMGDSLFGPGNQDLLNAIQRLDASSQDRHAILADRMDNLEKSIRKLSEGHGLSASNGGSAARPISALEQISSHTGAQARSVSEVIKHLEASEARHTLSLEKNRSHAKLEKLGSSWERIYATICCFTFFVPSIHPDGMFRFGWDVISACILVLTSLLVPLRLGFASWFQAHEATWLGVECLMDASFLLNIVIALASPFYEHGRSLLVNDRIVIARNYLTSPRLLLDMCMCFPASLCVAFNESYGGLRLIKVCSLVQIKMVFGSLERSKLGARVTSRISPTGILFIELLLMLGFMWHWVSCTWAFLIKSEGGIGSSVLYGDGSDVIYSVAFHWTVSVFQGLGAPMLAQTSSQSLLECAVVVGGSWFLAYLFGAVANAVAIANERPRERQRKLNTVKEFVRLKRVPPFVRARILDFFEHKVSTFDRDEEGALMGTLPSTLQIELAVVVNQPFLKKVNLFKQFEPAATALISLLMVPRFCLPDDNIILEGEYNSSLFMIRSGELGVYVKIEAATSAADMSIAFAGTQAASENSFTKPVRHLVSKTLRTVVSKASGRSDSSSHQIATRPSPAKRPISSTPQPIGSFTGTCASPRKRPTASAPSPQRIGSFTGGVTILSARTPTKRQGASRRGGPLSRQGTSPLSRRGSGARRPSTDDLESERIRMTEMQARSELDVVDLGTVVAKLGEGDAFGEQSFVNNVKSNATVRTLAYTDLLTLSKSDLTYASQVFPGVKSALDKYLEERKTKYDQDKEKLASKLDPRQRRTSMRRPSISKSVGAAKKIMRRNSFTA